MWFLVTGVFAIAFGCGAVWFFTQSGKDQPYSGPPPTVDFEVKGIKVATWVPFYGRVNIQNSEVVQPPGPEGFEFGFKDGSMVWNVKAGVLVLVNCRITVKEPEPRLEMITLMRGKQVISPLEGLGQPGFEAASAKDLNDGLATIFKQGKTPTADLVFRVRDEGMVKSGSLSVEVRWKDSQGNIASGRYSLKHAPRMVDEPKKPDSNGTEDSPKKSAKDSAEGSRDSTPSQAAPKSEAAFNPTKTRLDPDKAIEHYNEAISSQPTNADAYRRRGNAHAAVDDYARALNDQRKAVEIASEDAKALNDLAWTLATAPNSIPPDSPVRNGTEAIRYARLACKFTQFRSSSCLDTLAAAYAEAGCFEEAASWQQKAIALENDEMFDKEMSERLFLYQEGKPLRRLRRTSASESPKVLLTMSDQDNRFLVPATSILMKKGFHVLLHPQILTNSIWLQKNLFAQAIEMATGGGTNWFQKKQQTMAEQTIVLLESALAQKTLQPKWPNRGQRPRRSASIKALDNSGGKNEMIFFDDTYWLDDPWAEIYLGEWTDKVSLAGESDISSAARLDLRVVTAKSPAYMPSKGFTSDGGILQEVLDHSKGHTYDVPDVTVTTYSGKRILKRVHIDLVFPPSVGGSGPLSVPSALFLVSLENQVVEYLDKKIDRTWFEPLKGEQRGSATPSGAQAARETVQKVGFEVPSKHWPTMAGNLTGRLRVSVNNPNDFNVRVGLRSGGRGKDFLVRANDTGSVTVPGGRYDIYFQYSSDPQSLYQGDSFTLNNNDVEIQIVKVINGNYGIRKVK